MGEKGMSREKGPRMLLTGSRLRTWHCLFRECLPDHYYLGLVPSDPYGAITRSDVYSK